MKGYVKNGKVYIEYAGSTYGPYKMRKDYEKYRIPFETILNERIELLLKDLHCRDDLFYPILDFETDNPDIDILRMILRELV